MFIYSGKVKKGKCGESTDLYDYSGNELFVGDIVITSHKDDIEAGSLTAVVQDNEDGEYFIMGLKSIDFDYDEEWSVRKLKDWKDVIDGEKWEDFGFNYKAI